MIKWLTNNFTPQTLISLLAFLISGWTAFKNRTYLKIIWNHCELTMNNSVAAMNKNGNPIISYTDTFLISLIIVNPSPNDVAYYDLKVFDADNQNPLEILFSVYFNINDEGVYFVHYNNSLNMNLLSVPKRNYGVFKANSYTRFNLPVVVTDEYEYKDLKRIRVEFKVAKNTLKGVKKYYKEYNVTNWQNYPYKEGYGEDIRINLLTKKILSLKVENHILNQDKFFENLNQIYKILYQINEVQSSRAISLTTLKEVADVFKFIIDKQVKPDLILINKLKSIQEELKKNKVSKNQNSMEYLDKIDHDLSLILKVWD